MSPPKFIDNLKMAVGRFFWKRAGNSGTSTSLDVLVISTGGVASSMLARHIQIFASSNDPSDKDGLKHLPVPPLDFHKILFIHGNLRDAATSVVRRGLAERQIAKLGGIAPLLLPKKIRPKLLSRLMSQQVARYEALSRSDPSRVLVIHFDELWDSLHKIAKFLGVSNRRFVSTFPEKRERSGQPSDRSPASH